VWSAYSSTRIQRNIPIEEAKNKQTPVPSKSGQSPLTDATR